jgi:Fe2+ transport system protein B
MKYAMPGPRTILISTYERLSSFLFVYSEFILILAAENKIITIMTTVELRTSIMEELDQMSVEMLESVSKYVKRLRHHTRSARKVKTDQNKREAAMLFVKNLSVQGGMPVPAEERGVEALVNEKYDK